MSFDANPPKITRAIDTNPSAGLALILDPQALVASRQLVRLLRGLDLVELVLT